ncbi:MAG: hypothetical protein ACREUM_05885 [Nitrosospira sp.]
MSGPLDDILSKAEPGFVNIMIDTPKGSRISAHIDDLPDAWVTEIEHFFVSYNQAQGRAYKPIKHGGPQEAEAALTAAKRRYTRHEKQ